MKNEKKSVKLTLTGVPNVGKSTLFNSLTGKNVHTGNWSGKTVESSVGYVKHGEHELVLEDLPGAYSLSERSEEERVAVRALLFSDADGVIVVADESRLFSNLNFIIQVAECARRCVLCLNFADAAKREGTQIDTDALSRALGIPVVRASAKKRRTLDPLLDAALSMSPARSRVLTDCGEALEKSILRIAEILDKFNTPLTLSRPLAQKALLGERELVEEFCERRGIDEEERRKLLDRIDEECKLLFAGGYDRERIFDAITDAVCEKSEEIFALSAKEKKEVHTLGRIDRLLTGRLLAYPAMLLLFGLVLFVTVKLASYPSDALEHLFSYLNLKLKELFVHLELPPALIGIICDGALSTLFTVVAVMLPPMAFFFPFFTLLEDSGYLPRVAYNLDRPFAACGACGKQSLTMCMGLGCNAVGIMGARIIDSPRERLLAILTNSFVPCNGRFPLLIVIIGAFFVGAGGGALATVILLAFLIVSFAVTLAVTLLLSRTVLRGECEFFTLELPPYRMPDFKKVLVRSLFDRTLKVLGRAAAVALPTGAVIWLLSNLTVGGAAPIRYVVDFLDPVGRVMGIDGVMLTAFVLGLPANETVLPIALSLYGGGGTVAQILTANGWGLTTAICASLFTLFHWPCSTSVLTVRRETRSLGWTLLSVLLPTAVGFILCAAVNGIMTLVTL